jgi:hypothetical protein
VLGEKNYTEVLRKKIKKQSGPFFLKTTVLGVLAAASWPMRADLAEYWRRVEAASRRRVLTGAARPGGAFWWRPSGASWRELPGGAFWLVQRALEPASWRCRASRTGGRRLHGFVRDRRMGDNEGD